MARSTLNFAVDLVTFITLWALLTTGLLIKYVLPPGTGRWLTVLGKDRHGWGDIHFYLAVALCGLLVVHVLLHWRWVCETARRLLSPLHPNGDAGSRGGRALWGAVLAVFLTLGTTITLWQCKRLVAATDATPCADDPVRGRGCCFRGGTVAASSDQQPAPKERRTPGCDACCDRTRERGRQHAKPSWAGEKDDGECGMLGRTSQPSLRCCPSRLMPSSP